MAHSAAQSIALALGVSALVTVACRRARIPALLPLMIVGLGLGHSGIGAIDASALGGALKGFITVAIGLLIFEGALHLNKEELARAPRAVWGLLTVGAVITWAGATCGAHYLLGMHWPIAVLLGATVIVTGPTVVQPILRLLRISPRAHAALSAEAILIDPLGVVATIATLEVVRLYLVTGPGLSVASEGLVLFVKPLLGGAGVGLVMGVAGFGLLRLYGREGRLDSALLNLIAVGICMTCVGLGEAIAPEAGLAAVTICGVIMARARVLGATELRAFKELLAVMLVGTLFVLLASRFRLSQLSGVGWRDAVFVLGLVFVVRPVAVFFSTIRSRLTPRERLFAGTFAPRGIVALSVATIVAVELDTTPAGVELHAWNEATAPFAEDIARLEPLMFVIIAGTVLLASSISPFLAWIMGLRAGEGASLMIVGGHPLGTALARAVRESGVECRIIDSNEHRAASAVQQGLDARVGNAADTRWMDDVGAPYGAGWLLAWTGNHDVDQVAARWAIERLGPRRAAIWSTQRARGPLEKLDISQGEEVTAVIDRLGDGLVRVERTSDRSRLDRLLGWVSEGRFALALPGMAVPDGSRGCTFIGLTSRA